MLTWPYPVQDINLTGIIVLQCPLDGCRSSAPEERLQLIEGEAIEGWVAAQQRQSGGQRLPCTSINPIIAPHEHLSCKTGSVLNTCPIAI